MEQPSLIRRRVGINMVKRFLVVGWFIGLMVSPVPSRTLQSAARGTQMVAGIPQDPSSVGHLNLHKRHPDGAEGIVEFNYEFSSEVALGRLTQIQSFLASFRQLTMQARIVLPEAQLQSAGNTGAEMQSIGFHNIPLTVEGALLKQDYQLRQAQYELAQLRRDRGDISEEQMERAKTAYQAATRRFQMFWDTKRPID